MTHTYDAMLMDMQMPVMDGIAATRAIRRESRHQSLPVIAAMTANAMRTDQERCLAAGMNDYVTKLIDPDHLFKVLLKWIAPEHGRAEPQSAMPAPRDDGLALDLPVIDGLDVETGLRRVLGKRPLYHKLLHTFIHTQETIVAELESALRTGDRATAERLAHTADDAQAHECFESHQQALRSGLGEVAYLALERAIGQYDYPHALETLLAEAAPVGSGFTVKVVGRHTAILSIAIP